MKRGHRHSEIKKGMMMKNMFMNEMFMNEIKEHLSDEDKKKLLAAKLDMKISMIEQKSELMKEKKKLLAAKFDMKTSMVDQKLELLKMLRGMLKE